MKDNERERIIKNLTMNKEKVKEYLEQKKR